MAANDGGDLFDLRGHQLDEGRTEMVIFVQDGKVIQRFARPMLFVAYDPSNAAELANVFLNRAKDAGAKIVVNVPRRKISRETRDVLITRAIHVYRSMTEQKRAPALIAQHVVDTILSAID